MDGAMTVLLDAMPDPSTWMVVPTEWPAGRLADAQAWARVVSAPIDGDQRARARTVLETLAHARASGSSAVDRTYVFLPELSAVPTLVDVAVLVAEGEVEARHRQLGRADSGGAVGVVQVDTIVTDHLGVGTTVLRFDASGSQGGSRLTGSWRAVWRVGGYDLIVGLAAPSPDRLLDALPSAIELVRSLRLVPEPD